METVDCAGSEESGGHSQALQLGLGRVVMADAEIDERLFRWLVTLLPGLPPATVSLLFRADSSESKVKRIQSLLRHNQLDSRVIKVGVVDLGGTLRRMAELRKRRNALVHAFYDAEYTEDGSVRRFTSRDRVVDTVSLSEAEEVARELSEVSDLLEVLRQAFEYQRHGQQRLEALALLEDARELLVVSRLAATEKLTSLTTALRQPTARLAMGGLGQFRVLADHEDCRQDEVLCEVAPDVGRLDLYPDGREHPPLVGGDTGWVDATAKARAFDPNVKGMWVRRIHGQVQTSYASENPALLAENPWSLELRPQVFGTSPSMELVHQILESMEGFAPVEPSPDHGVQAGS